MLKRALLFTLVAVPTVLAAQAPVATAFRNDAASKAKNLIAAAETMPAEDFAYKPTPAEMSFAGVLTHLAEGNDFLCAAIGGVTAPSRTTVTDTSSKAALVARLKETFAFCDQALASLDDSKLTEMLPMFGGRKMTRAAVMTLTTGDWADHYSQASVYLRLKGQTPPTAVKKPAQ
jgi:uncharacterized damage-inducible protein DinB